METNILVAINKNYSKHLNILLNSIQYSNKEGIFNIYILHKNLSMKDDINIITRNLDMEKFNIFPIQIPDSEIDNFPVYEKRYPIEIYFRLYAAKYLPNTLDRILYLDSDTLVINPLSELYEMDFEDNYFIAATHIKKVIHKFNELRLNIDENSAYINTGVLLINLKKLRDVPVEKDVLNFLKKYEKKLLLPDQDIISGLYGDKIKLIDNLKYNFGERTWRLYNLYNPQHPITIKWICKNTVIIHYYGRNKPWNKNYIGHLNCFYNKVVRKISKCNNKKVLVLSCGTGGGHNSAAMAIKESLISKGVEADFIEYLDIINPTIKNSVNNLYIKSTGGNGSVFKTVYHLGKLYQKTNLKSPVYGLNSLNKNKLYRYIKNSGYSYVVTTHLFAAQALSAIKKIYPIRFMQIATDYVCIPFWNETNPDFFVIPNKDLIKNFSNSKINKEKLLPLGIPVKSDFSMPYKKSYYKEKLGLKKNVKYVLILTGSMGFGNVIEMVDNLQKAIKKVCFIVSCGNNNELYEKLKEKFANKSNIIPLEFKTNLSEYMKASEIILTKPGGLTTTEIATLRKPFIHTMPIPGCENYNANFFANRKMSLKCNNINEVVENTKKLLEDKKLQLELIKNQKHYIDKDACNKITDVILKQISR